MKHIITSFSCLFILVACSAPVTTSEHAIIADGNTLNIKSGTVSTGRFISVENKDRHWEGSLKGGREMWGARKELLEDTFKKEIGNICGEWFYTSVLPATYNMLDKDETMGGMAPVLGIAASMAAYMAAYSSTQDENIPISVYTEFTCRKDEK